MKSSPLSSRRAAPLVAALAAACAAPGPPPEPPAPPVTRPEASDWTRTSTHADVDAFLRDLTRQPASGRLARHVVGTTNEGRDLWLVVAADPQPESLEELASDERLRLLVNANIHGGEVEGKEAVQMLLRELALGEHTELLEDAVLLFVPVYNADGNDAIDVRNRVTQNGPDGGVGERPNAQGLDLNRDFVKVESPECAALLGVVNAVDPHLFLDLHTTNGSYHGYHLTYSPSLSTNVDPELDAYERTELLPAIRARMAEEGWRVFDYGNFAEAEGGGRNWETYDHRPRFGTNYHSLRNRLSLLSEAYSYLDFETRIRVTRAFVLESLRAIVADAERVRELCRAADERTRAGDFAFGWNSVLAPPVAGEVLVGAVDEVELEGDLGTRRVAREEFEPETMGVRDAFVSRSRRGAPLGWAVADPPEELGEKLRLHGIDFHVLGSPRGVEATRYRLTEVRHAERPFQGHHECTTAGEWEREATLELPAGALVVPARQRLGRVAAQLLEPESEDSLATWNLFDTALEAAGGGGAHPVLRLLREEDVAR